MTIVVSSGPTDVAQLADDADLEHHHLAERTARDAAAFGQAAAVSQFEGSTFA